MGTSYRTVCATATADQASSPARYHFGKFHPGKFKPGQLNLEIIRISKALAVVSSAYILATLVDYTQAQMNLD